MNDEFPRILIMSNHEQDQSTRDEVARTLDVWSSAS